MEFEVDPWPVAQEALFSIIRVWTADFPDVDQEKITRQCLDIMDKANGTPGAAFIFVCELARMVVGVLARYLCVCNDEFPGVETMLAELEMLELDWVEEFVVAEEGHEEA